MRGSGTVTIAQTYLYIPIYMTNSEWSNNTFIRFNYFTTTNTDFEIQRVVVDGSESTASELSSNFAARLDDPEVYIGCFLSSFDYIGAQTPNIMNITCQRYIWRYH